MSINIGDQIFLGPFVGKEFLSNIPGVYVIFCRTRKNYYEVIDVGESEDVKTRINNHEREIDWLSKCNDIWYSYIPIIHKKDRCEIERRIRKQFNPICGEK